MTTTTARLRRALATTLLASGLLATSAGAAGAATGIFLDSEGDTWTTIYDKASDSSSGYQESEGPQPNADITGVRVRHTTKVVELTVRYAQLDEAAPPFLLAEQMRFDSGPQRRVEVNTYGGPRGRIDLLKGTRRTPVDCGGLKHVIDYFTETVTITIPRTCLGSPRWIETQAFSDATFENEQFVIDVVDNGQDAGAEPIGWTTRVLKG